MEVVVDQGVCSLGSDDPSFASSQLFYPKGVTKTQEKLEFYSKHFPLIEVDTSAYSIPQKSSFLDWAKKTPEDFTFYFKAFGLFCGMGCPVKMLPFQVKDKLPESLQIVESVSLDELDVGLQDLCWQLMNESLLPFFERGKLGAVLFQFQKGVNHEPHTLTYIEYCRSKLDPRYEMAVEFRSHSFYSPEALPSLLSFLRERLICLVAFDELMTGAAAASKPSVTVCNADITSAVAQRTPPKWLVVCQTHPTLLLMRIHRRTGEDRQLNEVELAELRQCLTKCLATAGQKNWPKPLPSAVNVQSNIREFLAHIDNDSTTAAASTTGTTTTSISTTKLCANAEPEPEPSKLKLALSRWLDQRRSVRVVLEWNTNWSNHPMKNIERFASQLPLEHDPSPTSSGGGGGAAAAAAAAAASTGSSALPTLLASRWKAKQKQVEIKSKKSILSFFSPQPSAKKAKKQ